MECSCLIVCDNDNGPKAFTEQNRKAKKRHTCCECGRIIEIGEIYRYESGIWENPESYKICLDCISIRDVYFCGYVYGQLWEEMNEIIEQSDGNIGLPSRLTTSAKNAIINAIQKHWDEEDEMESAL